MKIIYFLSLFGIEKHKLYISIKKKIYVFDIIF